MDRRAIRLAWNAHTGRKLTILEESRSLSENFLRFFCEIIFAERLSDESILTYPLKLLLSCFNRTSRLALWR
jgi:hypothetical protein